MFSLTRMCSGEVAITVWTRPRFANFTASAQRSMSFGCARDRPAITAFLERRAIPECPGANRPDGPQGPIRSSSPPIDRVGRNAAGIARARTALAAPPRTPNFSLRISIARPFGTRSSAKTVDGLLPSPRSKAVLDEKALKPQCQKMVRWAVLVINPPLEGEGRLTLSVAKCETGVG